MHEGESRLTAASRTDEGAGDSRSPSCSTAARRPPIGWRSSTATSGSPTASCASRSTGWPAALAARGLDRGAPVALVLPNVPAFPIAFLAILRAGAVAVPLNPHFKEAELEFHFRSAASAR